MHKRLTRILILMALLLVVFGLLVQFLPNFIDKEKMRLAIQKGVNESTGVRFTIKELTMEATLFHGLQVHLNTGTLRDLEGKPLADVDHVTIQIRYLPLLTRKTPEIAKIHLNDVYIPVKEESLFTKVKLKYKKPEKIGFLNPAEMKDTEVLLTNYRIEDFEVPSHTRLLLPTTRRFYVDGEALSVKHLMSDRPVSLLGDGRFYFLTTLAKKAATAQNKTPSGQMDMGRYELFLVIPQESLKEGKLTASDLERLTFRMEGSELAFDARYRKTGPRSGLGTVETMRDLPLQRGEALYHQLSDTFAVAIPDALKDVFLAGKVRLKNSFQVAFLDDPKRLPKITMLGDIRLFKVSLASFKNWRNPPVKGITGPIHFYKDKIVFPDLRALVGSVPVFLKGTYYQNREVVDATLRGNDIPLSEIKRSLVETGTAVPALQQTDIAGLIDFNLRVTGHRNNPAYRGTIAVQNGRFVSSELGLNAKRFNANIGLNGRLNLKTENFQLPAYNGYIRVLEAEYEHPETGILVSGIQGRINLGDTLHLQNFTGRVGSEVFRVRGKVAKTFDSYNIHIASNNINLPRFRNEVLAKLPQFQELLAQLQPYRGTADVNLTVATGGKLFGRIDIASLALQSGPDYPITIPKLTLLFNNHNVTVPGSTVNLGPVALRLEGFFNTAGGGYKFNVASNDVMMSFLRDNSDLLMMLSGIEIPQIWNTAGSFAIKGTLGSQSSNVNLAFHEAGLSWQGGEFPLYDINGDLLYKQASGGRPVISSSNLTFRYGNSPVNMRVSYQDRLNFKANGILSPLLVNHFLTSPRATATPYREIPFHALASGVLTSFSPGAVNRSGKQNDVAASLHLDLTHLLDRSLEQSTAAVRNTNGAAIAAEPSDSPLRLSPQPEQVAPDTTQEKEAEQTTETTAQPEPVLPSSLQAPPTTAEMPRPMMTSENAFLNVQLRLLEDNLQIPQAVLHLFDSGNMVAEGQVSELMNPDQTRYEAHVFSAPEISLKELDDDTHSEFFENADGSLAADLTLRGTSAGMDSLDGWVEASGLAIPYLTLRDLTANVGFAGQTATFDIPSLNLPGISTSATARTNDLLAYPFTLNDVKINGSLLNIDSISDFNLNVMQPILIGEVIQPLLGTRQEGDPVLPFQFRDADLHFNEVIFQNIILENLQSQFSVFANSFFELENTSLTAAGGQVTGYLSMNPADNNFLTLDMNAEDVKANALTRALLNVTNQIFGDVDGKIRFTTFGQGPEETLANANGTVSVRVTNGRLPAIAKVETLLTAANVLRGGVLGLNLNNLFRSLAVYNTNYFAEMSGDFLVAEKVLYTENLVSDGEDLDLFIQGTIRMDDGEADLLVNGLMSQDVSGRLGELGKLSVGSILRYVPGIGTFGHKRGGLIGLIPGLGYTPGFGGPAEDTNRFQVRIKGSLDEPNAIQDFRWVRSRSL